MSGGGLAGELPGGKDDVAAVYGGRGREADGARCPPPGTEPGTRGHRYDSAERRQELAASLEGLSDCEAVQARLNADQDQATPPTAAVAKAPKRGPKARNTRGATGQTKLLQKGIGR